MEEKLNQKQIGNYTTDDGENYTCVWYQGRKEAKAWGPTSEHGSAASDRFTVKAENMKEAKKKLKKVIGPGNF